MKRAFILFVAILVLSGCDSNTSSKPTPHSKEETVQELNEIKDEKLIEREPNEQDKKYIKLLLNKEYDTIIDELFELESKNSLKSYFFLAKAFKKKEDFLEFNYSEDSDPEFVAYDTVKYAEYILVELEKAKYIPKDIEDEVNELEAWATEKKSQYAPIVEEEQKQREQDQINETTRNPQSVSIGMTKEEVLTEGWGRPQDVNRTITANGTSEQWVYAGYRYLYFEDGILVTIQD
ncbi:hypothetical protein [Peribacillus sp. Hz7]|uniref:hypothetical protein n=1 Tax=Peribacillus sp. Hz7 TaxID=3344873 RepID=UPI0035CB2FA7